MSGATLGSSDWALRKLGVGYDDTENRMGEVSPLAKGLTKVGGFGAELGGNIGGLGGGLVKALAGKGLKGLKLGMASGGIEGLATGATSSDTLSELPKNVALGGLIGTGGGAVGEGLTYLARPFSARSLTKGMKGGLNNVVENPEAVKLLNQGIKQSDDVTSEFLLKSRPVARGINKETANMVDGALTSRIDVPETIKDANARYGKYMDEHGADEVFNFAPLTKRYKGGDDVAVVKSIRRNMSKDVPDFKFRTNPDGSYDYEHFISDPQRTQYLSTFKSTYKNPQIRVNAKNKEGLDREYLLSEYFNNENNKAVYDKIVKDIEDGTTLTKIAREGRKGRKEVEKELLKAESSQASETGLGLGQTRDALSPELRASVIMPQNNIVVNSKLPHINSLYDGLTEFQGKSLKNALNTGFSKTNAKRGSLESLNKVKQEINEQIKKAMSTEKPSEVWQLEELKHKFDNAMPEGLKVVDKGYERAKRLQDAFDRGTHYNPNNVEGADYISELSPLEQNAFAQGLFKRINNNSLTGKNLANTALGYENTLASVLRGDKYDDLMKGLNKQSTKFERLAGLGRKAESKLNTPEAQRFFGREQLESKGSMIGSALDWLNTKFRHDALERAGKNLLNPNYVGDSEAWLIENYPIIAGYLSSKLNQEVNQ